LSSVFRLKERVSSSFRRADGSTTAGSELIESGSRSAISLRQREPVVSMVTSVVS
jgi:hypothetical protein